MRTKHLILDLLNDEYSIYVEAKPESHLVPELGFDSLDMPNIMADLGLMFSINPSAKDFFSLYGSDPTVNDLIEYCRVKQFKHERVSKS